MNIYPAIDIKGGAAVRLMQGLEDQKTEYYKDPVEPARLFKEAGTQWVHVVDLDGAFSGASANLDAIERIAALGLKVQMGGGIRTTADIERILSAGVSRFVVGTRACESQDFVAEIAERWPEAAAVGIDARDGMAAIKGWVETTNIPATELALRVADVGIRTIIYTDISTDGMLSGPNFDGQKALWQAAAEREVKFIASGGVHDLHDITHYHNLAQRFANLDGVIIGKAIYEGKLELADALKISRS